MCHNLAFASGITFKWAMYARALDYLMQKVH